MYGISVFILRHVQPHKNAKIDNFISRLYYISYAVKYIIQFGKIMKIKTRSILQELNEIAEVRNKDELFESRATNIINSAINLLESLYKHYGPDEAGELERRFINAIKGQDSAKFSRGIRRIAESRKSQKKALIEK